MRDEQATVTTRAGECPVQLFVPGGEGPWPAVIVYMDAGGIRPGMADMARRLAAAGYLALLPDLYYRYGPYAPLDPRSVFAGDYRAILGPLMATIDPARAASDSEALLTYLDTRGDVAGPRIGGVGFCMGGGMAIAAAGAAPDRFAAVASFHGGRLATDDPASPHRFVREGMADVYLGIADGDPSYPPDMAARFEATLDAAGVRRTSDIYHAAHGWMMPDFPVYDPSEAERGWAAMLALFERTLR